MSCKHENIVPKEDDPCDGYCTECGESGFPIFDPEYDAFSTVETLREFPNDEIRKRFIDFLGTYVCLNCGLYDEEGKAHQCACTRDD